ncbi:hypothetical protein DL764_003546 [Monosporascus ibericus]|uniref:Hydrophobin n=1 Tax=Monosporascus ibericus TaxID=155417 RepID=A0A4Q4THU6_9PEZI|nr:hypothetical protein DL764_003546 [Monosporascus ibericus]
MRVAILTALYLLAARAAAQTAYCCTLNSNNQIVLEADQTAVCCDSARGRIVGDNEAGRTPGECELEVGLYGFEICCRQQTTYICDF